MIRKLIVTKYVPQGASKPSGHMCKAAGYKAKRISYNHGAHDPGEHAAMQYARDVILPEMNKQRVKYGGNELTLFPSPDAFGMPNERETAYLVRFMGG